MKTAFSASCLLTLLLSVGSSAASEFPGVLQAQRDLFAQIEKRIPAEPELLEDYAPALSGYPLWPSLQASVYQKALRQRKVNAVSLPLIQFIEQYPGAPFAESLRAHSLGLLFEAGQAETYLRLHRPNGSLVRECHFLQMRKQNQGVLLQSEQDRLLSLWRSGTVLDDACKTLVREQLSPDLTDHLRRIEQACLRKSRSAIEQTLEVMGESVRGIKRQWGHLRSSPELLVESRWYQAEQPVLMRVAACELMRRSFRSPTQLIQVLREPDVTLPEDLRVGLHRAVALALAGDGDPRAPRWLRSVPDYAADKSVWHWRIVDALARQDWVMAATYLHEVPPELASQDRWRYLRGRVAQIRGDHFEAFAAYMGLQQAYNYYGFLARTQIEQALPFAPPALEVAPAQIARISEHPGYLRAREWAQLGNLHQQRREWHALLEQLSEPELAAAGWLASTEGWHNASIFALGRLGREGAWTQRFPVIHPETVLAHAQHHQIDPSWALAIARQESALAPDARSHVGARGLMQLMPGTARMTARRHGLPYRKSGDLYQPALNIALGVAHLADLVARYEGNYLLATAAYNAGPGNADRWQARFQTMPADFWIEAVSFRETRNYLRNVVAYNLIYAHQLERNPTVFRFLADALGRPQELAALPLPVHETRINSLF